MSEEPLYLLANICIYIYIYIYIYIGIMSGEPLDLLAKIRGVYLVDEFDNAGM
jgi:hypothetical protein